MHRTIGYLSKRFVQIRPGEGQKVALTFCYFFLIITSYYVIKPVSRSLVLGGLGSRMVPYVDLICALLMGPIVTLFARLVDRMPKARLVSLSFWMVMAILVLFWKLLAWPMPWITGAFYIWVAIFSVLVVTLFWLVANDLYHPREAKRLFGFIGSGGILGGIVGSSIAAVGAQVLGTEHLLLLSVALLGACWMVVQRLWTFSRDRTHGEPDASAHPPRDTFMSDMGGFAKLLLQSRYLMLLVAMVALNKIIATLIYYQLNPFIEQTFIDPDAKTTFAGMFFGSMNVAAFIIQFFFTSWILRRWGLLPALVALPIGVLAGTTGLLFLPVFWLAAGTELYDGSLNYSLQQTTKEVLYLPIDRSIRYKVKPFIDMVVFRFGKGLAAILGIVLLDTLRLPPRVLSYVAIPLLGVWLVVAVWARREYITTIRTLLQARAMARRARQSTFSVSELAFPIVETWADQRPAPFGSLTDGPSPARKIALLSRLVELDETPLTHAKELIAELAHYEHPQADDTEAARDLLTLKAVIWDQQEPMAIRRQAIRLLARSTQQSTVDYLFGLVTVEIDAMLRHEAVLGLVKLRVAGKHLEFPVQLLRRQIAREVANYQRIASVAGVLRQHYRGPPQKDDAGLGLLRILKEESVEQIFRLLMLLYRPEDIHLIYEQLREPDMYVRADAIELLDNLVDSGMRFTLFPILDEDHFLSLEDGSSDGAAEPTVAYRVLQEAIWDHNCWLSVTTLCTVGRLRLSTMRQELEKASRHSVPLISAAARVALHLSVRS